MNYDKLQLWLDDLCTTTEPQTRMSLNDENGFCCLGRLCEVAIANGATIVKRPHADDIEGIQLYDGKGGMPPRSVAYWLEANDQEIDPIYTLGMSMNDRDGKTFKEIAAEIEKRFMPHVQ